MVNAEMLTRPQAPTRFLESATKSLTLDEGLGSLGKLGEGGFQFRHIGLSHIQFLTTPGQDPNTYGLCV